MFAAQVDQEFTAVFDSLIFQERVQLQHSGMLSFLRLLAMNLEGIRSVERCEQELNLITSQLGPTTPKTPPVGATHPLSDGASSQESTEMPRSPLKSVGSLRKMASSIGLATPMGRKSLEDFAEEHDAGPPMSPGTRQRDEARRVRERTRKSLAAMLWYRRFIILYLEELSNCYGHIRWLRLYWSWAQDHPIRHSIHTFFSHPWATAKTYFRGESVVEQRKTAVIMALSRLAALENRVVESIGRMHGALHSTIASLRGLSSLIDQSSLSVASQSPTDSISPSDADLIDISGELEAIVTRGMHAIAMIHEGLHFDLDVPHGHSVGDLVAEETLGQTISGPGECCNGSPTLPLGEDPLKMLATICRRSVRWSKRCNNRLRTTESLPRGRHWGRTAKYGMFLGAGLYCWYYYTVDDARRSTLRVRELIHQMFQTYAITPAKGIWDSLVVERYPSEQRRQLLQDEKDSLTRMILDYHDANFIMTPDERVELREAADREDLGAVNVHYERAIQKPIRSAMFGNLFRILLIQLQKQKVDIDRVLLTSEEVLEQNDLSFRMMAMAPMMFLFTGLSYYYFRLRVRRREAPIHRRLRLCWRSTHRVISNGEHSGDDGLQDRRHAHVGGGRGGGNDVRSESRLEYGDHGYVLLFVHEMRMLVATMSLDVETRRLMAQDLDDIENTNASRAQRLRTLQRMYQTYGFLHPPHQ